MILDHYPLSITDRTRNSMKQWCSYILHFSADLDTGYKTLWEVQPQGWLLQVLRHARYNQEIVAKDKPIWNYIALYVSV